MLTSVTVIVFWTCIGIALYVYCGYPLTLLLLRPRPLRRDPQYLPRISVLIAAFNEQDHIVQTVRNKLDLDYPEDLVEVIVVSDGSTDETDARVLAMGEPRVTLIRQEPRQGKSAGLNLAVERATGELIVFADANSIHDTGALRQLAAVFADPGVGYATGRMTYGRQGSTSTGDGCGLYMKYESQLRVLESRVGSVIGVNGGIDAMRRELYRPMRADHLPDFILPLWVAEAGKRVVYAPDAVLYEDALQRAGDEYRMRVRVSLRALHTLVEMRHLLDPRRGLLAFQLFVHKLLRYLLVWFAVAAVVANVALARHPLYAALLVFQFAFYVSALCGFLLRNRQKNYGLAAPYYLLLVNTAAGAAMLRLLRGDRITTWTPRKGV